MVKALRRSPHRNSHFYTTAVHDAAHAVVRIARQVPGFSILVSLQCSPLHACGLEFDDKVLCLLLRISLASAEDEPPERCSRRSFSSSLVRSLAAFESKSGFARISHRKSKLSGFRIRSLEGVMKEPPSFYRLAVVLTRTYPHLPPTRVCCAIESSPVAAGL
jgi:hypothetical protein